MQYYIGMPLQKSFACDFSLTIPNNDINSNMNSTEIKPEVLRTYLATKINNEMKIAAAIAIASCVEPTKDNIVPYTLDKNVVVKVAEAVAKMAKETGDCR